MNIFISGIAGFLGSHLADKFIADGHTVYGNDNFLLGSINNVPKEAHFMYGDCKWFKDIPKDIDVLYHCAATAHEGLSVFSPSFITSNIYGASVNMFSAAIAAGVKRIVFCSSMARYGKGERSPPFRETFNPQPVDPYGIAKVAAEDTLRVLCETHGIEYVIAVPHNIIGVRQNYIDPFRNVAAIMINRMKQGKQPIIYGDGRQIRCFSPVEDVIVTLAKFATEQGISGSIFNVGPDDDEISIMKLANTIADILEFPLLPIFMPDRPLEVKYATCASDKVRKYFGYKRVKSLKDCLKDMCDWIIPHPFEYKLPLEIVSDKTPRTWREKLI